VPGEQLVIDWTESGRLHLFCAVLPWSRRRFVRFALDEKRQTTLRVLAECFDELAGVPAVLLSDCACRLKAGTGANVVVRHPTTSTSPPTTASGPTSAKPATPSQARPSGGRPPDGSRTGLPDGCRLAGREGLDWHPFEWMLVKLVNLSYHASHECGGGD
jgi:hypothetical protein